MLTGTSFVTNTLALTDPGHLHQTVGYAEGLQTGGQITAWSGTSGNQNMDPTTTSTTGVALTGTVTVATNVTSNLVGNSGNMPPAAICNAIVYLGV